LKSRGRFCTCEIALLQHISESRVRQLWSEYRKKGSKLTLKKTGRSRSFLNESREIISFYMKYHANTDAVEFMLKKRKAISSIIATLILIVITVIAGIFLYSFVSGYMGTLSGTTNQPPPNIQFIASSLTSSPP